MLSFSKVFSMMSFSRNICFWSRHTTSWSFCPRTPKTSVPRLGPSACQQVARCLTSCQREERRRCGSQRSNECVIPRIWSRVSSYLPHRIRQEVWLTWGGDQIIQLQSTPSRKKVMHSILFTWDRLLGMISKISDTVLGLPVCSMWINNKKFTLRRRILHVFRMRRNLSSAKTLPQRSFPGEGGAEQRQTPGYRHRVAYLESVVSPTSLVPCSWLCKYTLLQFAQKNPLVP